MKQARTASNKIGHLYKRFHNRCNINNYPVIVKKQDGTKVRAFVSNISFDGIQIKCSRLSAHIFSPKSGLLADENIPDIELSLILPFKNTCIHILSAM